MNKGSVTIECNANERIGAVGMTGYGKSFFMLRLIQQMEGINVIIIDTKHEIKLPGFIIAKDEKRVFRHEKVIYRTSVKPSPWFWAQIWDKFGAPRKPDCLVYLDEAGNITGPNTIDDGLLQLVQAGRSVDIGVWWAAQQSVRVNNTLLSQTDKLIVFRVPVKSDRKKLAGVYGDSIERAANLPRYRFYAYGVDGVDPIEADDGKESFPLVLPG